MTKLLIAYDGSDASIEAIDDLVRSGLPGNDVEAIVLSVADVLSDPPVTDYPTLYPHAAAQVQLQVDEALAESQVLAQTGAERLAGLFPQWVVRSEVIAETPYWAVVKKAEEWKADLILVGSRGRSVLSQLVFGSVSRKALLYADCCVRVGRKSIADGDPSQARVVIGWDDSADAALAVKTIAQRQYPAGSRAKLVTAVNSHLVNRLPAGMTRLTQGAAAAADALRQAGLHVEDHAVINGDPKRVLVDEAATFQATSLAVGARGLSRNARVLLGSVAASIATRATCSVEVIRVRE